ncbi:TonB-dependent receptor [Edaphobacter paludis]|uniref:TonB-dependent receptor n=1 Tax=Edaphobacter paludis TaxID=3035702 RepID=A0AAU7DBY5_9BACT
MSIRFTLLAALCLFCYISAALAAERKVQICVQDERGDPISGALVQVQTGLADEVSSSADGCVSITAEPGAKVRISHAGFADVVESVGNQSQLTVVMRVAGVTQKVEVTAARMPLALDASASSVRTMTAEQLHEAPGFTLDDQLRQVVGFQLFRRTSSWVANPTTQGTSLRGLGSTAVSRTLVLIDQVPLNDAFGGWIHWNEIPQLAVRDVELMRGGASDLYGSSAIGGVIDVVPVVPQHFAYAADVSGASEATSNLNALLSADRHGWSGLGATTLFRTDGYILTAPAVRGPIDVASNVHSQSGRAEVRRALGSDGNIFLLGNILNEARNNGTPLQTNGMRLWRYVAGANWSPADAGRFLLRVYGSDQNYRQSFSSIAANRASEKLTNLQRVPSQQVGGAVQWARGYSQFTVVAGGDLLDTRATDNETSVKSGIDQPTVSISARQRGDGIYGEVLWQPSSWSIAFSSRLDRFGNFDAKQVSSGTSAPLPGIQETVFDPRLGIVKKVAGGLSLTASGFRAFRGPSLNELYRKFQVGQQITLANGNLRSERATGFETGALMDLSRWGSVRGSYFWTQVNRPVASVALSSTPTTQLLQRQNLGQLESRGLTAEFELEPVSFLSLTGGYQYAVSTVTKFQADPTLVGKWTAEVPRNTATLQTRLQKQGLGTLSVALRTSGQAFDDSANQFKLDGYAQIDLYAEHAFGRRWQIYSSVQNLLNSEVQAGRTPLLTLGAPRLLSVGVRLH